MASLHDVSLRQLQYVVAIADTLGFHRAAERCGVSQPSLSTQVKELEEVLGVQLFERDRRRVLVTPAGEPLIARARSVLLGVEDLLGEATRARDPFTGTFRVGVIPTIAPYLLPDIGQALAGKYPKLRLVFREERTAEVVAGLTEGTLDLGFVARVDELGELVTFDVMDDPFVAALPKDHALAKKKRLALHDLDDEGLLLLDEGHCLRSQALELCSRTSARELELRATSLATLTQMVSAGQGMTLLPQIAVDVENRRGQLAVVPFTHPAPKRVLSLAWRSSSPFDAAFRALGQTLKKQLAARRGDDALHERPRRL